MFNYTPWEALYQKLSQTFSPPNLPMLGLVDAPPTDQTQRAEAKVTTTAGDYANVDAIDHIDASPTKTNTLLDDLMEVECRAFEQYHQLPWHFVCHFERAVGSFVDLICAPRTLSVLRGSSHTD